MTKDMNEIASKSLGSSASYAVFTNKFDPSLLNPMPRALARETYGITGDEFDGFDIWHCYESTFLLNSGKPVSGTLKFVYPASSEFMVESKSMKLYLNSFDMTRMGKTTDEAIKNYVDQVIEDLQNILKCQVNASFFQPYFGDIQYYEYSLSKFYTSETYLDDLVRDSVVFDDFSGKQSHVTVEISERFDKPWNRQRWWTNSLRSRCRHTQQKDTGSAFFNILHNDKVLPVSLFKQVVSLREVNEFHEFCAEKLFVEISKAINPEELGVMLLYSRRGSLDINPVRFTKEVYEYIEPINPEVEQTPNRFAAHSRSLQPEYQALTSIGCLTKAFGQ